MKQIAEDSGISEGTLSNWMKAADVEEGVPPGAASDAAEELKQLRRRPKLLEQENEVLRRATAAAKPVPQYRPLLKIPVSRPIGPRRA